MFWDDPRISTQMLAAHLNPEIDAASRRPEVIDLSVKWLIETLSLKQDDSVLDLGCGPGLYASRLTQAGLRVTGMDYSRPSIDYATRYAGENNLAEAEVIIRAHEIFSACGISFSLHIGHLALMRSMLRNLAPEDQKKVLMFLDKKDEDGLSRYLSSQRLSGLCGKVTELASCRDIGEAFEITGDFPEKEQVQEFFRSLTGQGSSIP